ncbi:undecaprenyl-phosphate alpha-N-acetylglucosaminyl 1-phosphate transferase [Arhodomonas sp. AD133]|uniref:undecaprenyl-phosphate alpha-N-acetylglucosaminyl 1-phosphate transferase n=1 Tax=Arhodomonas sp. AD133 TaxID=3415009 RepID=UPI003EBB841B
MQNELFAYLLVFLFVVLLTDFLRRQALLAGLVDQPDARKRHARPVPPVGGGAIFLGCLLAALALNVPEDYVRILFPVGAALVIMGAVDDHYDLPPRARLAVQALAALCTSVLGGATLTTAGDLMPGGGALTLGVLAVPVTVLGTVGTINAFNMVDGMDGLSGALALVALVGFAVVAYAGGDSGLLTLALVLATGVLAFLTQNLRSPWRWRASVFLGDAGSMFLGFAVSWFVIELSQGRAPAMSPVTGLWLLLVPLFDIAYVMGRRVARGRSPLAADRQHLHHFLLRIGLPVTRALAVIVSVAIVAAATGLAFELAGVADWVSLAAFLALFGLYCLGMTYAWRVHPRLVRWLARRQHANTTLPVMARAYLQASRYRDERLHTP